jgi:PKD repeat protein
VRLLVPAVVAGLALGAWPVVPVWAQSDPVPQPLPYAQDFSALPWNSATYPPGWQGWLVSTLPGATFNTGGPAADESLAPMGDASVSTGGAYNYDGKIGFLDASDKDLGMALAVNATRRASIVVSYDIMTIRNPYDFLLNSRINEVTLQWRAGATGPWTSLTGIEYRNNTTQQVSWMVTTPQNLQRKTVTLPSSCDSQAVVQLRWVSREVSGSGNRPSFAMDNVTVQGTPNQPPVAVATADRDTVPRMTCQVCFDGRASSDPEDGTLTYLWDFGDGTPASNNPTPCHTYTVVATRTASLRVTDPLGAWDTAAVRMVVREARPPVANAGPDVDAYTGGSAVLQGSAIPDCPPITLWGWTVVEFPTGSTWTLSGEMTSIAFLGPSLAGDYVLSLRVADAFFYSSPDYVIVHVRDNLPPVAVAMAQPEAVAVGDTVHFDGSQSYDPEGGPLTYIWNFGDGAPEEWAVETKHFYSSVGRFNATLTVIDERDAFATSVVPITVTPPLAVDPRHEHFQLALDGLHPNPATGPFTVWFTLPSAAAATLDVLDVSGRRVVSREVGSLGPGRHQVQMPGALSPGLYLVRLTQGSAARVRRAVVLE